MHTVSLVSSWRRGLRGASLCALLLGAGCVSTSAVAPVTPAPEGAAGLSAPLTVVAISDFHGALEGERLPSAGGAEVQVGGAAVLAAYLEEIRAQAPGPVVLLDGGDMFQGTLASNLAEGAPVIDLYNALGVHAAALGNHEFDFGPAGPRSLTRSGDNPTGALEARVAQARFPILAANVVEMESRQRPAWLKASTLIEVGGVKIGIVGAATPETPSTTTGANVAHLAFLDPLPAVEAEARRLREAGAAWVLVTAHIGTDCPNKGAAERLDQCAEGELRELVEGLPEGLVDAVVGGHTHKLAATRHGRTLVLQAYAQGLAIAWGQISPEGVTPKGVVPLCARVVGAAAAGSCEPAELRESAEAPRPARFLGREIRPSATVAALIQPSLDRVRAQTERPLGPTVVAPFHRAYNRESPLGNLVADLHRRLIPEAELGMTNNGAVRANLPAGPLTYGQLYEALPFDNRLAVFTLSGAQLEAMVRHGFFGGHGGLSWSGLRVEVVGCELSSLEVGGRAVDPEARYRVVTNDYLARGGSGFSSLEIGADQIVVIERYEYQREAIRALLEADGGSLDPKDHLDPAAPRLVQTGTCEASQP